MLDASDVQGSSKMQLITLNVEGYFFQKNKRNEEHNMERLEMAEKIAQRANIGIEEAKAAIGGPVCLSGFARLIK